MFPERLPARRSCVDCAIALFCAYNEFTGQCGGSKRSGLHTGAHTSFFFRSHFLVHSATHPPSPHTPSPSLLPFREFSRNHPFRLPLIAPPPPPQALGFSHHDGPESRAKLRLDACARTPTPQLKTAITQTISNISCAFLIITLFPNDVGSKRLYVVTCIPFFILSRCVHNLAPVRVV